MSWNAVSGSIPRLFTARSTSVAVATEPLRPKAEIDHPAIDPDADEALAAEPLELALQLSLSASSDRREKREARSRPAVEDRVYDLLDGEGAQHLSGFRAVGRARARVEESKVIRNLGNGADRRPRALAERALLDGDGR